MTKTIEPTKVDSMFCADCGMHVRPANAFHPYLYCWLFKKGVSDPGLFLSTHGFKRDPAHWGEQ